MPALPGFAECQCGSAARHGATIMPGSSCNMGSWLQGLLPDQTHRDSSSIVSAETEIHEADSYASHGVNKRVGF